MKQSSFRNLKTKRLLASDLNPSKGGIKIASGIIRFGKGVIYRITKGWNTLKGKGGKKGPLLEPFAGGL